MKKNIVIIVLSVVALLLAGTVGYLIADKVISNKHENGSENNNKENNNGENNNEEIIIKELDLSKCLNTSYSYKNASDNIGDYGLSMTVNSDKKSITLSIDWHKFGPLSTASAWSPSVEEYQITGFSKNIINTFVGDVGQSARGITLFYIMDDGTIEYTPMFELKYDSQNNSYYRMNYTYEYLTDGSITGEYFETKGLINGVENIIKLYNVDVTAGVTGHRSTIGAKADGSFYDLGNILIQ